MATKSTSSLGEDPSVGAAGDGLRELEKNYSPQNLSVDEKASEKREPTTHFSDVESVEAESINASMETVALKALHVDDDVTLNPWTFRTFFLG